MNFIKELPRTISKPKLIPHNKQPERRLLSVFMSLLEMSPEVRTRFLQLCGYGAGRTCAIQSFMEVAYPSQRYSDVRPDGLIFCERGNNKWSAFVEAKARTSHIRAEQVLDYVDLAASLDVDAVITISNEFARSPDELPYNLPQNKLKKRSIFHFAWADIRTFLERVKSEAKLDDLERGIIEQCLDYMWHSDSGVATFDKMPQDWPKFVDSARTGVGFSSRTPGITEIVHAWQQERRDLCSKLGHELGQPVEIRHAAGARSSAEERLKLDRSQLADDYELEARYLMKQTKCELSITADLVNRKITWSLSLALPPNKKAKATITWLLERASILGIKPLDVVLYWKGKQKPTAMSLQELQADPEIVWQGQKDQPRTVFVISSIQNSADFRSARKFISGLETRTLDLVCQAREVSWL
jgi:hypothetical protein